MPSVYVIGPEGLSTEMTAVQCRDEDAELQRLLELNWDLLPGDQIEPDDPRRWLLIKREMPVPDPGSGSDRWSVDFVFGDQSAVPTFVECKRQRDTRSRREVVAQMLDYAANGHFYWTAAVLRQAAEQSCRVTGHSFAEGFGRLDADDGRSAEEYFQRFETNLREGQLRLIFFLERSSHELRSIVEFLNRQMEQTEVLIVEARQFEHDGRRIVVPTLFGYTEQARRVKEAGPRRGPGRRHRWSWDDFAVDTEDLVGARAWQAIKSIHEFGRRPGVRVSWGTGAQTGSFGIVVDAVCPRSLFTVRSNGQLTFQLGWLNKDEITERVREDLRKTVAALGISLADIQYPNVDLQDWLPVSDRLVKSLAELIERYV